MPLQRGEIQGYDFNRMVVAFTMLNQGKEGNSVRDQHYDDGRS